MEVLKVLKELIGNYNVYINETSSSVRNVRLLESAALYVTGILKVFGVIPDITILGFPVESQNSGSSHVTEEVCCTQQRMVASKGIIIIMFYLPLGSHSSSIGTSDC